MRFSTRNAFYLRASSYRVVPLFLYLDERHVDWMTDTVLQLVIGQLQGKMRDLLLNSRHQKKHKVYVERGEGYQYCYFLRTTTRTEVVLLKDKAYSLRPPTPPPVANRDSAPSQRKRATPGPRAQRQSERRPAGSASTPRPPARGSAVPPDSRSSRSRSRSISARPDRHAAADVAEEDDSPPLRAMESDSPPLAEVGSLDDAPHNGQTADSPIEVKAEPEDLEPGDTDRPVSPGDKEDEEEVNIKDWKPDVSLTYKGFGTSSVQLVLIVEPYPPLPPSQYAPPSSRLSSRSASVMSARSRSRTTMRASGTGLEGDGGPGSRYTSASASLAPGRDGSVAATAAPSPNMRNMRNASRSVSATPVPNSRRGGSITTGSSATPFGADPSASGGGGGARRGATPLFMPRDTPFDEDDEDEDAHLAYTEALRQGRLRLPSVSRPAGSDALRKAKKRSRGSSRARDIYGNSTGGAGDDEDDDANLDDIPDGIMEISERLVRSSEMEEAVVRVQGGWEERGEGEESAVMGKEEPGD